MPNPSQTLPDDAAPTYANLAGWNVDYYVGAGTNAEITTRLAAAQVGAIGYDTDNATFIVKTAGGNVNWTPGPKTRRQSFTIQDAGAAESVRNENVLTFNANSANDDIGGSAPVPSDIDTSVDATFTFALARTQNNQDNLYDFQFSFITDGDDVDLDAQMEVINLTNQAVSALANGTVTRVDVTIPAATLATAVGNSAFMMSFIVTRRDGAGTGNFGVPLGYLEYQELP